MTTSRFVPVIRSDLAFEHGKRMIEWVEYPCSTITAIVNKRAFQVASPMWTGLIVVAMGAIHESSDTKAHTKGFNFGSMIIMKRAAERAGLPMPGADGGGK